MEFRRSRFIACLFPGTDYKYMQESLRSRHPKSTHVVYAYRRLLKNGQIEEGSSDDGEPKGCAGTPVLRVLRGRDLIDSTLLVVRYFGGIKLGTGGMVRAYSDVANRLLELSVLHTYVKTREITLSTSYSKLRMMEYLISIHSIKEYKRSFCDTCVEWSISIPLERFEELEEIFETVAAGDDTKSL